MSWVAVAVGGASLVSNVVGGNKAADAAREGRYASDAKMAESQRLAEESVQELEAMGIPSIEAQKIVLQKPEFAGLQDYIIQKSSAMEEISTDPRLAKAQMDALESMREIGDGGGLTESERAQQFLMQRQAAGSEQARQKSILQDMAERGAGGSGAELAARLSSSQNAAERNAMAQAQLAGQAQQRALQAMTQGGAMAGKMQAQQFGQDAQKASAADAISRFNTANQMNTQARNLAARQSQYDAEARLSNQQEMANKSLIQQDYQNRLQKQQSIANARAGQQQGLQQQASNALSAAQNRADGITRQYGAIGDAIGTIGGAAVKGFGSKDTADNSNKAADGGVMRPDPNKRVVSEASSGKTTEEFRRLRGYAEGGVTTEEEPAEEMLNNNGGYAGGGIPVPSGSELPEEEMLMEGAVVPGDEYEGDRVDAKVNSGEMVINVPQQQRLMDLLKGLRGIQDLGDEDIVMPTEEADMESEEVACGGVVEKEDGGVIPGSEELASGISKEYDKMSEQSDQMDAAQKKTKARMKALEVLMKG